MRKSKKLLGIALVPCMVGSLLAGCTASSDTDVTPEETEEVTTTEAEKNDTAEEPDETTPEETTEQEEPALAGGSAFVELLKGTSAMESYRMNSTITVNEKTVTEGEDDVENNVVINLEALTDGKGNVSLTIGADYEDDDLGIELNGDLVTISKVDDRLYLNLEGAYDAVIEALGDDSSYIEQYADAFDLTMDDIESLLVLGIPVGDLDLSKSSYADMEKALDLIYADLETAIDNLDENTFTQEDGTYTLTVNNDNLLEVADTFIAAFEGNIEDIYDAYVEGMKKTDYSDQLETVIKAIVKEVVAGIEAASEEELDEETQKELEEEIQDAIEEFQTSMDEAVQELEDGKEDFLDAFEDAVEEYEDSRADMEEELKDSTDTVSAVLTISSEGEEGSRTITSALKAEAVVTEIIESDDESYETTNYVSITVESVVEEGEVVITAPKNYTTLSEAVELAYKVYITYQEYSDDDDDSWGDDDDDDYTYSTDVYTQDELAELYGVTLKSNQVIACDVPESTGVVITAYNKNMEFYSPDDSQDLQMEFDDDGYVYVAYSIYDSSFDEEFYTDYYESEKIDDGIYYSEDNNELNLVAFKDDITVWITFEAYDSEIVEEYTNGDGPELMLKLLDCCEFVSAQ